MKKFFYIFIFFLMTSVGLGQPPGSGGNGGPPCDNPPCPHTEPCWPPPCIPSSGAVGVTLLSIAGIGMCYLISRKDLSYGK